MSLYTMKLSDSVDTMEFNLLEVPIQDKDIEGAVDNTVLSGDIYTDFLWLKKRFIHKWSILCKDDYERLRGFYTRQFSNAEVPIYQLLDAPSPVEESAGSGEYIQITTTDSTAKLASVEMLGNAEQDGTPTPDAPVAVETTTGENVVKITGKNLFDIARKTGSTTMGGLSIEVLDYSSIRVNGTVSSTSWCELMMPIYFLRPIGNTTTKLFELDPTKEYTLSAKVVSGTWTPANTGSNLYIQTSANNTQRDTILNGTPRTFTGADGIYRGWMRFLQGDVFNDAVLTFQLEEGSQATEYEAFGSKYTIFFPPDTLDYMIEQGGFTGQGLNTGEPNRIRTKNYIPVEPNTQYTMSVASWNTSIGDGTPNFSVSYYSTDDYTTPRLSNKDWTAFSTPATFTTPANCHFVRVLFNIGGYLPITPADMTGIRIRGGNLTPIELAKIGNYQDRIYKEDGKWYIEKQVGKVVFDGTEDGWLAEGGGAPYRMAMPDFFRPSPSTILAMSDHFEAVPYNANWNNYTSLITTNATGSATAFKFRYTAITSLADWKSWLSTHNTTVYYALATPTTTEITNEALIAQLDALESASLYLGVNNIGTETLNAVPTLVLGYYPYYPNEIISPKAVRMELTDGGIINACECRENVQITLRETVQ